MSLDGVTASTAGCEEKCCRMTAKGVVPVIFGIIGIPLLITGSIGLWGRVSIAGSEQIFTLGAAFAFPATAMGIAGSAWYCCCRKRS